MQVSANSVREVIVSARVLLVLCLLSVSLTVAADPPKPASADEIATAVRQLGDSRYTVREQATKRLWQAGAFAEDSGMLDLMGLPKGAS